ncbi:hypothetical protein ANO11243_047570 [Dothideomycetidae sp. 11243]|nr:hypothetical protein ANO11243_047570 [fungal sp. No.11243]
MSASDAPEALLPALTAAVNMKVDSYAKLTSLLAALLNLPYTTPENWVYKAWKPTAEKMIADAKAAGRLDAEGNVVKANLPVGKTRGKKEPADPIHGVKTGRVTKPSTTKGKGRKGTKKGPAAAVKDEVGDEDLMED